jgi:hypothetical protein
MEYNCDYLGNVSCALTTAALSNMPFASVCNNFYTVLGGLPNVCDDSDQSTLAIKKCANSDQGYN